jgi:S-formylglutathione hydrolase
MAQGTGDNFYKQGQLLPENLEAAVKDAGIDGLTLRYQEVSRTSHEASRMIEKQLTERQGYDHSYFFISTFGADHVKHAAKYLGLA